jgi:ABC-2 type transport system permease protein
MTPSVAIAGAVEQRRAPERGSPPTLWRHLALLWGLRATLARAAFARGSAAVSAAGGALILTLTTALSARGADALFSSAAVHANTELAIFLALLLGFLASTLWITWPVVTASVDDAAELSRFALFPVAPQRLFLASVLAGLVEPRTLPIWGALLGAAHGLLTPEGASVWHGALTTLLLAGFCVVWGRVGLHLLLNLFRHRRSAEAMGGGLLLLLGCAAFVPPPNLAWLRHLNSATPSIDDAFLKGSIATFTLLPSGGWAWAVVSEAAHHPGRVAFPLFYLVVATIVGYYLALFLLLRFHRRAGRSLPQQLAEKERRQAFGHGAVDRVLVEREWNDLLLNPRARLTVALPFFLAILVKLVGARPLAVELIGTHADAWLVGGIASYGALVLAGGFAQNCFGYDGAGAQLYFSAPVTAAQILRAKNIVHGGSAVALGLMLVLFYSAYVALPPGWVVIAVLCNIVYQALLFVSLGNVLSVIAPRKFHPSLKRRDRASALATALGLATASLAVTPGAAILRHLMGEAPGIGTLLLFPMLALVGFAAWRLSIPAATWLLATRKPQLLRAVAAE